MGSIKKRLSLVLMMCAVCCLGLELLLIQSSYANPLNGDACSVSSRNMCLGTCPEGEMCNDRDDGPSADCRCQ